MQPFELAEYQDRLARTRSGMAELGVDIFVVSNPSNMYYLTGYDAASAYVPQCVLVAGDGDPEITVRAQDGPCARHTVWMDWSHIHEIPERYIGYDDRSGWDHIASLLTSWGHGKRRIGLEGDSLEEHQRLGAGLPDARFMHVGNMLNRIRGVKSEREIDCMRVAGKIADRAMQAALDTIAPGVRECDVAGAIVAAQASGLPDAGGDKVLAGSFPSGVKTDSPHLSWTDEPYAPGMPVNIELGGSYRRYVAGLSRTISLGPPPDRLRGLHAATLEGMEAVFGFAKAGVTCEEVEAVFRATTSKRGFEKNSRIGYAMGIDWAENWASFHPGDRTVLEANMTFHLMLGMWQRDDWGLVLSEAFRIMPTAVESFSSLSRELFVR